MTFVEKFPDLPEAALETVDLKTESETKLLIKLGIFAVTGQSVSYWGLGKVPSEYATVLSTCHLLLSCSTDIQHRSKSFPILCVSH